MIFTSFDFVVFFIIAVISYFLTPHRFRWLHILVFSYFFYGYWKVEYLLLLALSTIIDYSAALFMDKQVDKRKKLPFLWFSLISNLGILMVFKYYNFFFSSFVSAFNISEDIAQIYHLNIILPLGISFYTFQTLSYTIDVYNGKMAATKHLGKFAAYVSFFPQLVAGPIERANNLLPQFEYKVSLDYQRIADGLKLMLWGFFKKLVVANRLMYFIQNGYGDSKSNSIDQLFVMAIGVFMIYADFSAYTDIARGAARVLGFELMENFKHPFHARKMSEFWSRWHISMTTWFSDYLYKPLLQRRNASKFYNYFSILLLMSIIGFWHGASWNFLLWGLLLGSVIIFENIINRRKNEFWNKVHKSIKNERVDVLLRRFRANLERGSVFVITALISPFFFTSTIQEASKFYASIWSINLKPPMFIFERRYDIVVLFFAVLLMWFVSHNEIKHKSDPVSIVNSQHRVIRQLIYIILLFVVFNFGEFNLSDFVYFNF